MNNWQKEYIRQFTDGYDEENGYYDSQFTTHRPTDILDFITTLLEKQREEYVEMIEGLMYQSRFIVDEKTLDEVINLIKSHDKTS